MIDVLRRKVIAVTVEDTRFLPGESIQQIFDRNDLDYGDGLKLFFANESDTTEEGHCGSVLEVHIVVPPGSQTPCMSMRIGDWQIVDGKMVVMG